MKKKKSSHNKIIIVVLIIAGVLLIWNKHIEDKVFPKRFGVVKEGHIYRSGRLDKVLVKRVLEKKNIKVIVALEGLKNADADQQAEIKASEELDIELLRFPLGGKGTGSVESYIGAVSAVSNAVARDDPVLVHCAVGTQRTGGVTAVYRALYDKWTPEQIYREMARYDFSSRDNTKLIPYLNENIAQIARELKEKGLLDEVPDPLPIFVTSD